ncbi:E3 ubiquitin-protein ligase RBBP6 isoform X2 [Nothobranchius furzeri]|uniref:Transcript variant X2 n=1 Tax=Nothobranchius furzeri TaxID=105023 RepID=A0A9D2YIM8_NOTFU|nr:transcript variant X2 [Nothobranchius furzeri]
MTHIHYKFSSKLSYDTVVFDGPHITLTDLKRQIMGRERLKAGDCDLQITNAQTKEEYTEDEGLISKGSSVIVRRIPIIGGSKSSSSSKTNKSERSDLQFPHHTFGVGRAMSDRSSTKALSYFSMMQKSNLADADVSEEDKIKVMMSQSSMNLNTKPGTVLPENYTCYRCRNTGHHIRNCPMNGDKNFQGPPKIRKSTGIPNSLLVEVKDPSIKGVMLTNCGRYAIPAIDAEAYAVGKKEKPPFIPLEQPKCESKGDPVPAEFLCLMCRDLLGDAVVIPCCGSSYCDDCIRSALLDSEDHVCPTCGQSDVSPDTLVANRFLRQVVNNFKKGQGCAKNSPPASTLGPALPPVGVQSQLQKPPSSDAPPEAAGAACAETSSNTSLNTTESQAGISNEEVCTTGKETEDPIPAEFLCLICRDLLGDAVVIPCCGSSYCDDCIRSALLDSEDHVCPTCGQSEVSPDTLVANKFLRQAVVHFKNGQSFAKSLGKGCVASQSKNSPPGSTPVPTPPPVGVQTQLLKPPQSPCSQKESLLNHLNTENSPPLPQSSDVPPEATATEKSATTENSSSTFLPPTESQLEISHDGNEGKTGDDSATVPHSLLPPDKTASDVPDNHEPQVSGTEVTDQLQTADVSQRNSSSDSTFKPANPWSDTSSSGGPTGSLTGSNTQQRLTTSSPPFPSYATTSSPLFPSPPVHTFLPTHQLPSTYSPAYALTTPTWKLPAPLGAPIPSLCSSTTTPSVPVLIPKEWYRYQRMQNERSPQRRFSSYSNPKSSKSKSSRSYSPSSSRSRSRSRPFSPHSTHRDSHPHSNPSTSYGYKRPHSSTPSSSSSSRGGHSQSRSSSQHRKSRHHRKRSSSSSRSSRRCKGAERSPYDISSLEVERQSYLQWKKDYQEWYDKYFSTFINHFHQMLLPPPLLPPPPPPPYPPFSFCPPPHDSHSSRLDVCSPSSETSSSQRSSPSHSSNDFHSMASHHSNDSPLPYKANDGYSSPSESSSDGHSAPCHSRAKLREFSDSCKEKSRPVTKGSEGANLQDLKQDQNQQIFKTGGTSGQLSHGKKQKKMEAGRAKDSSGLDSTCDLRQEKRRRYDGPSTHKDGPSVRHKESVGGDLKSVHPTLEKDQNNHASKANKDSRLGKEQRRKSGQDTDCRRATERENKKKPCNDLAPERRGQLGGSKSPEFRSEENQKRKWEETEKNVKESPTQRCKGPKTRAAEPQRCDSKCVKPPARETQKPEEMKPRSVAQKNVWEGGLKVLPQKKISININLDVKRLEDTSGQQNSSKVDVRMQENKEQTGDEKNKEPSDTEVDRTKESSPGSYVTTEELTCVLEEVRENKAAAEEEGRENKEMEDVDLWHCALSGVKDEEEDHMMGKEETLKRTPRETREEPRRSSSMTNKSSSLHDGFSITSKRDRSSLGSGGVGGSREKKTVVKRLEGNFPGQAQSTQNHLKQISQSKSTNDEKQAIVGDTDTSARPTRSHMTGYNEKKKQQSTFGGRNRDSVTLRGREEMKEQRWSENRGMLAPSGGGGGADSPLYAERDGEIRTEREKERTREGERLKDSKRLRQGSWGDERKRDCDASVQNRNHISSSSVSCDRERRDQLRGDEQSRTRFSNSSRESVREIPSVSRYALQPSHNFPKRDRKRLSAEYRDQSRPTRIQQSPPSLFHCHSADQFHVLVEPSMSFEREFSHWELTRNSRTQKREPEKVLKTRAKETPVSGRVRGESRWEDEASKLDERRRSSSDSNRSSSRH